jgi:hypothetical protein
MPIEARRIFRLSLTTALALAGAYALALPLPFLAPLFALLLTAAPVAPMGLKGLLGLILVVLLTLGVGLLMTPMLTNYSVSAVLITAIGLYFSTYLTVNLGKGLVGMLLTVGFTLIPAAGTVDFVLAVTVIKALVLGIGLAIVCQWLVYPWFPEDAATLKKTRPEAGDPTASNWIALRATLIVLPPFLLAMSNPSMYLPIILKSVSLGQQGSVIDARHAGRELLGSTFLAGSFAVLFWFSLKLCPSLWMFFLWMLLFGVYFASKLYRLIASRFPPSFWQNVAVTMLILLGPAVQDSAGGKDVYKAFAVRMSLFVAVTLYAWLAIHILEQLRTRHQKRLPLPLTETESPVC